MSQIFRKEKLNSLEKWMKMNKRANFLTNFFNVKKKSERIFYSAELKQNLSIIYPSSKYCPLFKSFAINSAEPSIIYKEIFIFYDINQSESTSNGHGIFH